MPVKIPTQNQHVPLHEYYGEHNCCLCKSEKIVEKLTNKLMLRQRKLDKIFELSSKTLDSSNPTDYIEALLKICKIINPKSYVKEHTKLFQ